MRQSIALLGRRSVAFAPILRGNQCSKNIIYQCVIKHMRQTNGFLTQAMTNEKPRAGIPGLFASKEAEHLEQGASTPLLEIPKPRPSSLGFGYHEQAVALVGQREALHPVARSLYGESSAESSWATAFLPCAKRRRTNRCVL